MTTLQYLESLCNTHPELDEWYNSLAGDALIQLYHNFITDFETKINLLKLSHFAVIVSRQYPEKKSQSFTLINMQIAVFKLEQGDQKEYKKLLDNGKSTLGSMTDIDPSVYANYYWVSSQYYNVREEFAEFHKSALLYLVYTSLPLQMLLGTRISTFLNPRRQPCLNLYILAIQLLTQEQLGLKTFLPLVKIFHQSQCPSSARILSQPVLLSFLPCGNFTRSNVWFSCKDFISSSMAFNHSVLCWSAIASS
ncbi:hypothetical protein UlMin_000507 [Ulmus minor]